jgi:hypothetical protein
MYLLIHAALLGLFPNAHTTGPAANPIVLAACETAPARGMGPIDTLPGMPLELEGGVASSRAGASGEDRIFPDTSLARLLERLRKLDEVPLPLLYVGAPLISGGTPVAFGGSFGDVGVGFGMQLRTRYTHHPDGVLGATVGLGNPWILGADAGVTILDLRRDIAGRGGFGRRGSFALKLHKRVTQHAAVAVGMDNVFNWGGTDVPESFYAVASLRAGQWPRQDSTSGRIYASLGLGSGRFEAEGKRKNGRSIGVFANIGLTISQPLRVIAEWTGQDLGIGVSALPVRGIPMVVTATLNDLIGTAGDGVRPAVSFAYGFSLPRTRHFQ